MARRLKVLISAYACEPHRGSEPAVGWNWVRQAARFHDVWVIARRDERASIESHPFGREAPNVHWVYYEFPKSRLFWKFGGPGIQLYYYLWQWRIGPVGRRLQREVGFDVIHHVTLVRYWTPTALSSLPVPLIFGPVGGGETAPKSFYPTFGTRGLWIERLRDLARWTADHEHFARATLRRAFAVFATTEQTAERARKAGARRVGVMTSFAFTEEEAAVFANLPAKQGGPFRLISIGRLLHWKGFHLGLQAFAAFRQVHPESEYWIVNEGPDLKRLQGVAAELGIQDKVVFWGRLPRLADVRGKLAESDVLVHPSLHDNFGNVCLEALAAGKPVLCLDWGGPALQVTPECGIKVFPKTPEQTVAELAAAMERLYREPDLRRRMGESGRRRVHEHFSWDQKGDEMMAAYVEAAESRPRP